MRVSRRVRLENCTIQHYISNPLSRQYTDIRQILIATKAQDSDVSINLDNQRVYVRDIKGLSKRVTRTVYRVRFEDGRLIGHLLNRTGTGEPWPLYQFSTEKQAWHKHNATTQTQQHTDTQQNLHVLPKAKLLDMLQAYSQNDIRRYAIARLLYRKYHVKTDVVMEAGGDKWVRCGDCNQVFDVGSVGYLWQHYVTFCSECRRDVSVLPAEKPQRDTKADTTSAKNAFDRIKRE